MGTTWKLIMNWKGDVFSTWSANTFVWMYVCFNYMFLVQQNGANLILYHHFYSTWKYLKAKLQGQSTKCKHVSCISQSVFWHKVRLYSISTNSTVHGNFTAMLHPTVNPPSWPCYYYYYGQPNFTSSSTVYMYFML